MSKASKAFEQKSREVHAAGFQPSYKGMSYMSDNAAYQLETYTSFVGTPLFLIDPEKFSKTNFWGLTDFYKRGEEYFADTIAPWLDANNITKYKLRFIHQPNGSESDNYPRLFFYQPRNIWLGMGMTFKTRAHGLMFKLSF